MAVRLGPASSPVSKDGWITPKKVARRQLPLSPASLQFISGQGAGRGGMLGSGSTELLSRDLGLQPQPMSKVLVPVPIALGQGIQDDPRRSLSVPVGTVAPFHKEAKDGAVNSESEALMSACSGASSVSKLGLGIGSGSLSLSKDPASGPAKRARPVETLTKRMPSRSSKGKGKATLIGRGGDKVAFTFGASFDGGRGSAVLPSPGAKKARGRGGAASGSSSDAIHPIHLKTCTHDSVVIQLKQAIQSTDSVGVLDTVLADECRDTGSLDRSVVDSGATEVLMESVQAAKSSDLGYQECSEELVGVMDGALSNPVSS